MNTEHDLDLVPADGAEDVAEAVGDGFGFGAIELTPSCKAAPEKKAAS